MKALFALGFLFLAHCGEAKMISRPWYPAPSEPVEIGDDDDGSNEDGEDLPNDFDGLKF